MLNNYKFCLFWASSGCETEISGSELSLFKKKVVILQSNMGKVCLYIAREGLNLTSEQTNIITKILTQCQLFNN